MTELPMDAQLTLLLEIQDLRMQLGEIEQERGLGEIEEAHFGIDAVEAAAAIRGKLAALSEHLSEPVRRRLGRIETRHTRVLVPVISGTCYGCFVQVATATAGEKAPNAELQTCENCGRFLYFLP